MKAEIVIFSGDEEDQQPSPQQSAQAMPGQVYAATDAEFEEQMALMLRLSFIHINGLAPPPGTLLLVKPEPASPPRSPSPCSHGVQIGRQEAESIIRDRQTAAGKPCRNAAVTFRRQKPDGDDSDAQSGVDDGGGAAGQPDTAYEATMNEYKLRWRTRRDVKFIKSKFKSMHSLLWATWEREVPDAASKESKMAALLLADDMDDAVDDFILAMEPSRRSKRLIQTKIEASAFEDFKRRASDVSGRWKKTAHPICTLFPRNTAILSPRKPTPRAHPFVRKNASMLVPMDEPINELVKFLTGEDAESTLSQPQLKMASILGMAGMGKTTLADQVYEKIENKFDARAFVSVTQGGNIKDVLAGILEQVAAENTTAPPAGTEAESEEHILIDQISDFFKDKRK
uniref:Putative disease resistance RPP13-like protein 3 n=1 Tax=Aegilops tauschii TaxID=37682 RepID=M8CAI3_AEGTA